MGEPVGKGPLGRPRHRWVDNIKMHFGGIGWGGMDWIDLTEDRNQWRALVSTVMNPRIPRNAGKFLSSFTSGGLSRRAHCSLFTYKKKNSMV
jgi:hypothetical protein